jgi:hypothetical protein
MDGPPRFPLSSDLEREEALKRGRGKLKRFFFTSKWVDLFFIRATRTEHLKTAKGNLYRIIPIPFIGSFYLLRTIPLGQFFTVTYKMNRISVYGGWIPKVFCFILFKKNKLTVFLNA